MRKISSQIVSARLNTAPTIATPPNETHHRAAQPNVPYVSYCQHTTSDHSWWCVISQTRHAMGTALSATVSTFLVCTEYFIFNSHCRSPPPPPPLLFFHPLPSVLTHSHFNWDEGEYEAGPT